MHLTHEEYQEFKTQFYCAGAPYEQYCVRVRVDTPDGAECWTGYITAENVRAALAWLAQRRHKPGFERAVLRVPTPEE